MRGRTAILCVAGAASALALATSAAGVGPMPGLADRVAGPGGATTFTTHRRDGRTVLTMRRRGAVVRTVRLRAGFGIPAVTVTGQAGGVSADGRTLVLTERPPNDGLRAQSRVLVVSTATLAVRRTVVLRGEFGYDALSPDGRTLFLIQHTEGSDLTRYAVRAYDLRRGRLLPGAIVDKSEPGAAMSGYPVSRATGRGGVWVYTLYKRNRGKPFVHALNAAERYAVCVDLPWTGSLDGVWDTRLVLANGGARLLVRTLDGSTAAAIDTASLQVVATG